MRRLCLDEPRREVIGPGGRLRLTPIEYRLLHCLMRNAGHVVSRSALIRRVWGIEEGATQHDLSVFVACLRAKLTLEGDPQAIVTEPGLGYRVAPS
jgi:DNA-binding response OmpR family regulator